jgi:hypothetical protein
MYAKANKLMVDYPQQWQSLIVKVKTTCCAPMVGNCKGVYFLKRLLEPIA